jgi:BlaI family transcriptional regulator, penicillinase repressor
MARKTLPKPSERELEILRVLWDCGASTVREVHEILCKAQKRAYTTTLKFMQIMTEKGLVVRDTRRLQHLYEAAISERSAQKQIVSDLLGSAFGGSSQKLILHALSAKKSSPEEIEEIRRVLDQMEEAQR